MEDKTYDDFEKEAVQDNPAQTIAPPQLTLEEEPIPDPNIKEEKKK